MDAIWRFLDSDVLETAQDEMAGTLFCMFWFRFRAEMFSALSAVCLFGRDFVVCARLTVHYLAVYLVFGSLIEQTLSAMETSTKNVCVIIPSSFLCRCLQKVSKQHREMATFCIFEKTWTIRRPIFKITYPVWDISDSIDRLNESQFSRDSLVEY